MERGGGDEVEGGEISRIQPGHCVVWVGAGHVVGGNGTESAAEADDAGSSGAGKDREGNSGHPQGLRTGQKRDDRDRGGAPAIHRHEGPAGNPGREKDHRGGQRQGRRGEVDRGRQSRSPAGQRGTEGGAMRLRSVRPESGANAGMSGRVAGGGRKRADLSRGSARSEVDEHGDAAGG